MLKLFFTTECKRCLDWKLNPGTLTYKGNVLPLSYLGRQPVSIFSLRKPVKQTHQVCHKDSSTHVELNGKASAL